MKKFLVLSVIMTAIMAVLAFFLRDNSQMAILLSLLFILYTVSPAVIAFIAGNKKILVFCTEYLSLKSTNWKRALYYCAFTSISVTVLPFIMVYLFGDVFNVISDRINFDSSLISYGLSLSTGVPALNFALVLLANIIVLFVVGSLSGVVNNVFEEIAWRGYLQNCIQKSEKLKPFIVAVIWFVWFIPFMIKGNSDIPNVIFYLLVYIVLSYYLMKINTLTHSVWAGAAVRGIVFMPLLFIFIVPSVGPNWILLIALIATVLIDRVIVKNKNGIS